MSRDIFTEVRQIEEQAERILADAQAGARETRERAGEEIARCEAETKRKFEETSARLRAEHETSLAGRKADLERDFASRRAKLDDVASSRVEPLADGVASQLLRARR